jgi:hypothetical protein
MEHWSMQAPIILLYLVRDGRLMETKGDKFPIGLSIDNKLRKFSNHKFDLISGDVIYVFSDGYADQFGGHMGKKFKYDNFRSLLFEAPPTCPEKTVGIDCKKIQRMERELGPVGRYACYRSEVPLTARISIRFIKASSPLADHG